MLELSTAQRRDLRARAHPLDPIVAIGQHGLTPAVLHEIGVALDAHELIKVRVFGDDRGARETLLTEICAALACAPVQHIGKVLVLWRPNPEKKERAAKKPTAAAAPRRARTPDAQARKPDARAARHADLPTGKRAPAPRRLRGHARETEPVPEPRGDQARRRRRAVKT